MAWGKAGSTTLSSASDTLDVTGFTASKTMQTLQHGILNSSSNKLTTRGNFNGDTGNNYAYRTKDNGGTEENGGSISYWRVGAGLNPTGGDNFIVSYMVNIASEEKLMLSWINNGNASGAGNAPQRGETACKWANTSDQVTDIDQANVGNGDYDTNTNLTVLGSDLTPAVAISGIDNVQDNSLFVDKVNARRYWFSEPSTPDINDTFETDTKTAQNGTLVAWDSTDKRIEGTVSRIGTNTNWIYDLGSDLSATKFVVDFQFDIISNTDSTGTSATNFFMITSGTGSNQNAGGFSFTFQNDGSGGKFGINAKNSGDMESGNTWGSDDTFASNTTYYMRMIRDGDDFTCIRYSDTWGGTVAETLEKTVSGVTGLRYWRIQNYNGATSSYDGVTTFAVDNLKLYNGVTTTTPATWTMQPTYEDDFSTDKGWVSSYSTKMAYNGTTKKLDPVKFENENNNANITIAKELDFTLGTKFVVRFVLDFSVFGGSPFMTMGVSDKDSTVNADTAQDYLGIVCHNGTTWSAQVKDNTELGTFTNISQASYSGHQSNFGTDFYCELIRNEDSFTINIRTGSHTGTTVVTATTTISTIGTVSNLKYIKFGNYDGTSTAGYCTTTIDDLIVYNGVTTPN